LDRPYFVALGTIEGRKNHLLLLKIWDSLATSMGNDAPILVIIGQRGWEAQAAIAILDQPGRLQDHVYELRHCTDHELANWLSGARALLMPSFAEGFGLPVTEAMQLRIPVIASDLPVYREIAGEIPTYLDPRDAVGWEHVIKDFMGDSAERARQLSRLQHYRAPDWRTHFATVEAWLRRL
jgi:glycosyltransferase involved in cell wall biosynthesis